MAAMPAAAAAGEAAQVAKELMGSGAGTAARGEVRLPLDALPVAASASIRAHEHAAAASAPAGTRLLVSSATHAAVDGLADLLRPLGTDLHVYRTAAVIALTPHDPARVVELLDGDPRARSVERNRLRSVQAEPDERVDPQTGIPYGWAFEAVRAGTALGAVGGGSNRVVAVFDSGLDVGHDDLADLRGLAYNSHDGSSDVSDVSGHGTFVTGLISMGVANGIGGRGVAGDTPVLAIQGSGDGRTFTVESILAGLEWALENDASVINMSLAGQGISEAETRSLNIAFFADVLPVAAAGNQAQNGNPIEYPAAFLAGRRGRVNIGLSVAATQPDGSRAPFSNHNEFVSVAAPGGAPSPQHGVFSTIPRNPNDWDDPNNPAQITANPGESRWAYGQGTSFAAPIVSAIAALAWKVEPRLASEQLVRVLHRSARQPGGGGWNRYLGHGIVDAPAALQEAASYDVVDPTFRARARRTSRQSNWVRVTVGDARDRADGGDRPSGGVKYTLADVAGGIRILRGARRAEISKIVAIRRTSRLVALACDANGNCAVKRLGTFRPRA